MKKYIVILLSVVLFAGCESREPGTFRIAGKLKNGGGVTVYLDQLSATSTSLFTSAVADEDGNFELQGVIGEVGFYKLRLADNNFVNIVLHPDDNLEIEGDATYLYNSYKIKGSRDAIALYELNEYLRLFGVKEDSMRQVGANAGGMTLELQMQMQNTYNNMLREKSEFLKKFVDEHTSSIASMAAIQYLDPTSDAEYYIKLDKELYELYPDLAYVKNLHLKVAQLTKLAVGAEAPQILLNNPQGETVSLSSLRGKTVLIDFWASWCKPCRIENPHVVKLYKQYKDKGFEIYGVSLDKNKNAWVQAIQQDGLEWIHVSDLQFWNSAAAKLYDVRSIPQTYLIDEDGKIIAKGFRAAELEKRLKEIFG
ncbi:MAG: AhpC/TSA family protein [Flavobacteriales bacterium]|nr:AhpC/TSA family protein [Flavobacteriales bacterium]